MGKVIVLVGFSASGKDTLLNELVTRGFKTAISHTTRPRRNCEKNGVEYFFIEKDLFFDMLKKDDFAGKPRSYKTVVKGIEDTWYYGISKEQLITDENKVVILDIQGAIALKKELKNRQVTIFLDTNKKVRKERCITRGDFDPQEWKRRERDDKILLDKLKNHINFDIVFHDRTVISCARLIEEYIKE